MQLQENKPLVKLRVQDAYQTRGKAAICTPRLCLRRGATSAELVQRPAVQRAALADQLAALSSALSGIAFVTSVNGVVLRSSIVAPKWWCGGTVNPLSEDGEGPKDGKSSGERRSCVLAMLTAGDSWQLWPKIFRATISWGGVLTALCDASRITRRLKRSYKRWWADRSGHLASAS